MSINFTSSINPALRCNTNNNVSFKSNKQKPKDKTQPQADTCKFSGSDNRRSITDRITQLWASLTNGHERIHEFQIDNTTTMTKTSENVDKTANLLPTELGKEAKAIFDKAVSDAYENSKPAYFEAKYDESRLSSGIYFQYSKAKDPNCDEPMKLEGNVLRQFDEKGNVIKESTFNEDGYISSIVEYDGDKKNIAEYTQNGRPKSYIKGYKETPDGVEYDLKALFAEDYKPREIYQGYKETPDGATSYDAKTFFDEKGNVVYYGEKYQQSPNGSTKIGRVLELKSAFSPTSILQVGIKNSFSGERNVESTITCKNRVPVSYVKYD